MENTNLKQITSERLVMRNFVEADADDCFVFLSDRDTCYIDGGYEPYREKNKDFYDLMDCFVKDSSRLAITLKDSGRVVGTVHIMKSENRCGKACELGYVISPNYRRMGYAYEAITAVIRYLFEETETEMIVLSAYSENIPSIKLIEKLGFTYEGRIHRGFRYPPVGIVDMVSYYLDRQ